VHSSEQLSGSEFTQCSKPPRRYKPVSAQVLIMYQPDGALRVQDLGSTLQTRSKEHHGSFCLDPLEEEVDPVLRCVF
jgi:hypothetical protein